LAAYEQKWSYNKCSGLAILVSNVEYPGSVKHKGKNCRRKSVARSRYVFGVLVGGSDFANVRKNVFYGTEEVMEHSY